MKTAFIVSGVIVLSMAACAPQAEMVKTRAELYDLREEVKSSKARLQELQRHEEEIRSRIETLDASSKGTGDIEKSIADYGAKSDQLATDIQLLQGKLEENNFKIADLGQKLDDKTFKIAELSSRVDSLEARMKTLSAAPGAASTGTGTATVEKKSAPAPLEPSGVERLQQRQLRPRPCRFSELSGPVPRFQSG
jgi:chromosome segregation ATPase